MQHYGPDSVGGVAHKGLREDCPYPGCEWPREGDQAIGTNVVEWLGEIVDLSGFMPIIRTPDGAERTVIDLRKPDWGMYCPHGRKVMEATPAEHACQPPRHPCNLGKDDLFHTCPEVENCPACYPVGRIVEPWPCGIEGCTRERFEGNLEEETKEYFDSINSLIADQYR